MGAECLRAGARRDAAAGGPLGAGAFTLATVAIPRRPVANRDAPVDVAGAIFGLATVVALTAGLFLLALGGVGTVTGVGVLAVAVATGAAFVRAERRAPDRLIPLHVFRNRQLVTADTALLLKALVGVSMLYILTCYYQDVRGSTA